MNASPVAEAQLCYAWAKSLYDRVGNNVRQSPKAGILISLSGKCLVGICCQNDAVLTSMRRDDVASTFIRRHFHVMYPLGDLQSMICFYTNDFQDLLGSNISIMLWSATVAHWFFAFKSFYFSSNLRCQEKMTACYYRDVGTQWKATSCPKYQRGTQSL